MFISRTGKTVYIKTNGALLTMKTFDSVFIYLKYLYAIPSVPVENKMSLQVQNGSEPSQLI